MNTRLRALLLAGATALSIGVANAAAPARLHVPAADRRAPAQTYLTFPEWFLVFSPAEYADLLRHGSPDAFPWFAHIGQFWSAYGRVTDATRGYPFNGEYHTMIMVIGTSTTVEYGLRGTYETLVGRLTALTAPPGATAEDRLAAREAQDYVDFIRVRPWYEFDFAARLKTLWTRTPLTGPHLLRKWERRYLLTSEWGAKAVYGWLIGKATHAAYDTPRDTTLAVVRGLPPGLAVAGMRRVRTQGGAVLVALPRYQAFTAAATDIARHGARFTEIAGNRGSILVSRVVPVSTPPPPTARVLIHQPILTQPGWQRQVLEVPIADLSDVLTGDNVPVEHVFDY
ncbi:hypothetical protein [Rhodanobacter aciditrophus]|uniref:hypothetical protein n=1 Tax=Rhodanobacter aciditrophus TaxID=1623218 RepID=UPI003CF6031E